MKNLILCGGVGSRLWPLSRNLMPKQFFPLVENLSLFEKTVERNKKICDEFVIAVNSSQYFLAKNQLIAQGVSNYWGVLEPEGRNTAPAIALAAMNLDYDDIILVTPSDQLILNTDEYNKAVIKAKILAEDGYIVTFGIEAHSPETGFGYIKHNGEDIISFTEKPNIKNAKKYVKSGKYLWNSGMFCFKAGVYLDELKKLSPDVFKACLDCKVKLNKDEDFTPNRELMSKIPSISIDFAVMEKSTIGKVIQCDLNWSDLGSFDAIYKQLSGDNKNALVGSHKDVILNSQKNLIVSGHRKIACIDVEDLIIVDSADALLVAKRGSSQKVKEVVESLKKEDPYLLEAPMTVKRPWGSYTVLENPLNYKTKRIEIKPGMRLSLQYHKQREEHWIIVQGTGNVRIGEKNVKMKRGDHAYIPLETIHRVENTGKDTLTFIETQVGTYFGEDDIIRIEDDWGRT